MSYAKLAEWKRVEKIRSGSRELTLTLTSSYPPGQDPTDDNDYIVSSFDCMMNFVGFKRV